MYITSLFRLYPLPTELNIEPMEITEAPPAADGQSQGVTLLQKDRVRAMREAKQEPSGVVPWSPPAANWNAWTACNIG